MAGTEALTGRCATGTELESSLHEGCRASQVPLPREAPHGDRVQVQSAKLGSQQLGDMASLVTVPQPHRTVQGHLAWALG